MKINIYPFSIAVSCSNENIGIRWWCDNFSFPDPTASVVWSINRSSASSWSQRKFGTSESVYLTIYTYPHISPIASPPRYKGFSPMLFIETHFIQHIYSASLFGSEAQKLSIAEGNFWSSRFIDTATGSVDIFRCFLTFGYMLSFRYISKIMSVCWEFLWRFRIICWTFCQKSPTVFNCPFWL